jgi:hypothetical protein
VPVTLKPPVIGDGVAVKLATLDWTTETDVETLLPFREVVSFTDCVLATAFVGTENVVVV